MRLLAGVRADVAGLVLEPVEGLIAQGTFVGSRHFAMTLLLLLRLLLRLLLLEGQSRDVQQLVRHERDGCHFLGSLGR
jgi:hypothetical protein